MSGEIVRRSASDRPLTRAAAKKLGQIQDAAMLQRAEIDQQENTAAYHAAKRIENAYVLGHHLVSSAVELNREVTAGTAGNPALELMLRGVEEDIAAGSCALIRGYITRRS